jgi:DNA mismatch repair ATPase MutS
MGVPARAMRFRPAESLFTSLRVGDSLNGGVSYFQAEARRVKAAAELLVRNAHVVLLFDELFKGTNIKDAFDASDRVLRAFAHAPHGLVVVSSHLIELVDSLSREHNMAQRYFDATVEDGTLRFDYLMKEGMSTQRLGMAVLEREGVLRVLQDLQNPNA